jgi:glucose/arabinose dehydrogenase
VKSMALCSLVLASALGCSQQLPPDVHLTPVRNMQLTPVPLRVPEKFKGLVAEGHNLNIPRGYQANVFYAGRLGKPRFFTWGPDSVLYVANKNSGEIIALPDKNRDGVADTAIVAASGFQKSHDVVFYNGAMYVAEERRVIKCLDQNHDGAFETKSVFVDNIAKGARQPGGGHDTRTIVFDPAKKLMYLSIGSSCNVCREEHRAVIEVYRDDGTAGRTWATGIRNAVGMTLHNGELWGANNGSDWQGDDLPPEWIDRVRDGGFYGHPFAYGHGVYFDFDAHGDYRALLPLTAEESTLVRSMQQPAALIQAHSAPMQMEFANGAQPEAFRNGLFVVLRGSWNRRMPTGYKVIYLNFESPQSQHAAWVADFVTGFFPEGATSPKEVWGRPVGFTQDFRGNFYIGSDDITQCVIIVSPAR